MCPRFAGLPTCTDYRRGARRAVAGERPTVGRALSDQHGELFAIPGVDAKELESCGDAVPTVVAGGTADDA